jgi:hypothetical protein
MKRTPAALRLAAMLAEGIVRHIKRHIKKPPKKYAPYEFPAQHKRQFEADRNAAMAVLDWRKQTGQPFRNLGTLICDPTLPVQVRGAAEYLTRTGQLTPA